MEDKKHFMVEDDLLAEQEKMKEENTLQTLKDLEKGLIAGISSIDAGLIRQAAVKWIKFYQKVKRFESEIAFRHFFDIEEGDFK